jgi:O-antigen ligase
LARVPAIAVPEAAAWCVAGVYFLGISRFHQHVTPLATLQVPALLSLTALGLFFGSTSSWRPADLSKHWMTRSILVIATVAILSVPFALYPGKAFEFLNESYSRTILLWLVGWGLARTTAGAHLLAKSMAMGGAVAAGLTVMIGRRDDAGRLSGAYTYDPNDIAFVCVLTLPLALWWMGDKRSKTTRWLMVPVLPLLLYVIVKSGSRGAFLGMAAMVLGTVSLMFRPAPARIKKIARWVAIGSIVALPLLPADYVNRIRTIGADDDYNSNSATGRIEIWKRGLGYGLRRPLLGVGLANFNTAEGWLAAGAALQDQGIGWKWSTAHNSFVQLFAELGVLAGILFPYIMIRATMGLFRWHRLRPPAEPEDLLPPIVGVMMLAFMVNGMFLSFAYYDVVWATLALAAGLLHPMRRAAPLVGSRQAGAGARPGAPRGRSVARV